MEGGMGVMEGGMGGRDGWDGWEGWMGGRDGWMGGMDGRGREGWGGREGWEGGREGGMEGRRDGWEGGREEGREDTFNVVTLWVVPIKHTVVLQLVEHAFIRIPRFFELIFDSLGFSLSLYNIPHLFEHLLIRTFGYSNECFTPNAVI